MTREEFKDGLAIITHPETDLKYFNEWMSRITQHDAEQRAEIARLREALQGILEIGKRDMTNPKYDAYFEQAQQALKETP